MTTQTKNKNVVLTPAGRLSYCKIWTPEDSDNGKKVYSTVLILPPNADLKQLDAIALAAKDKKFPQYVGKKIPGFKSYWRLGTEENFESGLPPEYEGNIIIGLRSYDRQPGAMNQFGIKLDPKKEEDRAQIYSGCYALCSVSAFGYDYKGKKGVSLSLQNVRKLGDGEPLAGGTRAEDDFAEIKSEDYGFDNSNLMDESAEGGDLLSGM